jgi:hypothetical protein
LCVREGSLPIANRSGVATAELFAATPPSPDRTKQILDTIADPTKTQFFNADCVSCHTETGRAMDLQNVKDFPGIDPAVLPPRSMGHPQFWLVSYRQDPRRRYRHAPLAGAFLGSNRGTDGFLPRDLPPSRCVIGHPGTERSWPSIRGR